MESYGPPPATQEELFQRSVENLLVWAAHFLILNTKQEDKFLSEFTGGFSRKPTKVIYAPIFRMDRPNGLLPMKPIRLGSHASLHELSWIERDILKFQAANMIHTKNFEPSAANILPSLCFRIEYALGQTDPKVIEATNQSHANLQTLLTGLFEADVETPFFFSGIRYPWSLWVPTGGQYAEEFAPELRHKRLDDRDTRLFQKYWNELSPAILKKYQITASRLKLSRARKNPMERVIDLAIALEGLIDTNAELNFRLSVITASVVEHDPGSRFQLANKLKNFYDLRSRVVHGKGVDKRWAKLGRDEVNKELDIVERAVRKFMKLQLLNEHLRNLDGQTAHLLGVHPTTVTEMRE